MPATGETIARIARESTRRLVAFLAARSGDLAASEDALADAFAVALETWPLEGLPARPEAWLLTVARRRLIDGHRHGEVREEAAPALRWLAENALAEAAESETFPDERLKLMFVCAHPAIDPAARTPLMLQAVLGLDAATIAEAFLVKPAAMGQRLSRAKAKIRDAAIPFEVPASMRLPERLDAVLQAIYAAYGLSRDEVAGADPGRRELSLAAFELAGLLHRLLPEEPEAAGLLALMMHCEARRPGRQDAEGNYLPLSEQDPSRWSREGIWQADRLLARAAEARRLGRFQLEAAIQSCHSRRAHGGETDWAAITTFYEALCRQTRAAGAWVARAAALAQWRGVEEGLRALDELPLPVVADYQAYWALRAHLLRQRDPEAAAEAYRQAMHLCRDAAMREFLHRRLAELP
ncbi:MAG: RNA polymerase subunit sigma-70 [Nevskiaceae bacterium]|nr:MAG: RNA polymerase subunit sigma-70 [Nevskiaceae bacterium]TAM27611.1 MAG: RNA polymerase subunit sigma-70 [Nevskiaceae bacterium]